MNQREAMVYRKRNPLSQNEALGYIIIFLCLFLCSVFSFFKITNYISLISIIAFMILIYINIPSFFVKYLCVFFSTMSSLAGVFVIEIMPSFLLTELNTYSHSVGAFPLICLGHIVLIVVIRICDVYLFGFEIKSIGEWRNLIKIIKVCNIISLFVAFAYGTAFLKIIKYPSFILRMDRFTYINEYGLSGIYSYLVKIASYLLVFPIISIVYGNRKIGAGTIILYILYCAWTGNKFGPFYELLILSCIVFYKSIIEKNSDKVKKVIIRIGITMTALVLLAAYLFAFYQKQESYLYNRLAQQGQLWWKTYEKCQAEDYHISEINNELNAILYGSSNISDNIGSEFGIYRIMYYTTSKSIVDAKLARGSRYTEAGYACAYYYFGILGVFAFSVFIGVLMSLIVNNLIKAISEAKLINIILLVRLFSLERNALSMFEFISFFDFESIISYMYLLVFGGRFRIRIKNRGHRE